MTITFEQVNMSARVLGKRLSGDDFSTTSNMPLMIVRLSPEVAVQGNACYEQSTWSGEGRLALGVTGRWPASG
jgi:hypothetical protein